MSLCCILLGWHHFTNFVGLNMNTNTTTTSLKVMSYNVGGFEKIKDKELEQKRTNGFFKLINKDVQPDIFCTQETGWRNMITKNTSFKYQLNSERVFIFSKYPFVKSGEVKFDTDIVGCVWGDIKVEDKIFRLYNIHLASNKVTGDADKLRKEAKLSDLQEKETWLGIKSMLKNFKFAAGQRAKQAEKVARHIADSPHPVIIVGDFNDTPQSYTYHQLSKGLKDAFKEKAFGLGTSFAGSIPGLRIDYTLFSPSLKIVEHQVLKEVKYSDHYPVFTKIQL